MPSIACRQAIHSSIAGTFAGALDDYQTFCADDQPQYSFPEVVYELDVQDPCTLSVTVDGVGTDPVISMRSACETDEALLVHLERRVGVRGERCRCRYLLLRRLQRRRR